MLAKKYQIPTLAVAVADQGGLLLDAVGSDGRFSSPLTSEDSYPIYSITKTYIAALLLKFADEGKVDLDSPASDWIADAPEGHRYSLRQLLNHTSGLPEYTRLDEYNRDLVANPSKPWTRKEFIQNTYKGFLSCQP